MVSDDGPEFAAEAIQRGPRTVAMLKNKTSQKFISLRSWDLTSGPTAVDKVRFLDEARKIPEIPHRQLRFHLPQKT